VIPMRGWLPGQWYDETGLPWVQPSPNLPSLQAMTLYPGTCLLEGTNVSEGRGTTRPFEVFGAPWIDPFTLVDALRALALGGVAFRPMFFTPTFSKHADAVCGGVQIHVLQRESLQAVYLGLGILRALGALFPKEFAWRGSPEGHYFIDYLMGTDQVRRGLDRGLQLADLQAGWDMDLARFSERCQSSLLYPR
jgi:uncharacterized protein YbbC (DUF1343 family)